MMQANSILIIDLLYKHLSNHISIKKNLITLSKTIAEKILLWESNKEKSRLYQFTSQVLNHIAEFPEEVKETLSLDYHYEKRDSLPKIWQESARVYCLISHIILKENTLQLGRRPKDDMPALFCQEIANLSHQEHYSVLKTAYQTLIIARNGEMVELEAIVLCLQLFGASGVYSLIKEQIINFQPIINYLWEKEEGKALAAQLYVILKNITLPHMLQVPGRLIELYRNFDPQILQDIASDKRLVQMFGPELFKQLLLSQNDDNNAMLLKFMPETIDRSEKNSLLMLACEFSNVTALKILLEKKCDTNHQNIEGNTPLMCAIIQNRKKEILQIMDLLINNRADVSIPNNEGLTPLHALILPSYYEDTHPKMDKEILISAIEMLLSAGADINATCQYGNTALHLWCEYTDPSMDHFNEIITFLLERGANPDLENEEGETPFSTIN